MIVEGAKRLAPGCLRELQSLSDTVTKQFVCLRDVWHDHILFVGDKVTGVIDYDAMEIETPAGDVARLLGSLAGEDETMWRMGLAAYEELRTPEPEFWKLVRGFDSGNLLLSGLQWLEWRFVERREFARSAEAAKRISHWARRIGAKSRQNG